MCGREPHWSKDRTSSVAETPGTNRNFYAFFSQLRDGVFVNNERIVAVGLLTQADLIRLGPTFSRVWPVDQTPCFSDLLRAIDNADRALWRERHDLVRNSRSNAPD
jgi:hypothetical protein